MLSLSDRPIKLGLIGDNIAASSSPVLHETAARKAKVDLSYKRLVPADEGLPFDQLFQSCKKNRYRGLNITYPYKEKAMSYVTQCDPIIREIGAVNTVCFEGEEVAGYNTDYTGFMAGYQTAFKSMPTGKSALIGCGGVGRAMAFGLLTFKAPSIHLFDRDMGKAQALKADLERNSDETEIIVFDTPEEAAKDCEGILNATPVGMVGYGGRPVELAAASKARWVFDAVYTPLDTEFLQQAKSLGLSIMTGWELFFWQGVQAFSIFTGAPLNRTHLRDELTKAMGIEE